MATRLAPYRITAPHDEIANFALANEYVNYSTVSSGSGDAGVFVTIASGNLDLSPVTFTANSYLGNTNGPYLGFNS
jgi:hypothetical protein